jgi:hypothetical protein
MGPLCLDHEFIEYEQWGDPPTFNTTFDEVGYFQQRVALQHLSYFQRQDGTSIADVIDHCIFCTHLYHTETEHEDTIFYDTFKT